MLYVIKIDGFVFTDPMPLSTIINLWGSVQKIESKGFTVEVYHEKAV